ncbi:MAG: tetratricopeptide repeat protein [Spirochaetaceae bacterium]|jgi:tetratricopeptide (TPR) repeat protein|nr:tetratricopeptide repeat protein [Spirochaetaceae bacterium]
MAISEKKRGIVQKGGIVQKENLRKRKKRLGILLAGLAVLGLAGCSSAPKRPAEIFTLRNTAENQLETANQAADRKQFEDALTMLEEVRRLAVSVDDPRLLIRERIARGNILYAQGAANEASAIWSSALAEAETEGEQELAGSVRIYMARSALLSAPSRAEQIRDQVRQEIGLMKKEKLSIAFGWIIIGLAERSLGNWTEGEAAVKQALTYHEKNNYLEKAAEDWYIIAAIRSGAGQYDAALSALRNALALDRRAENSYGLGMDWRAMGDVLKKTGNSREAQDAYRRAIAIFRSIELEPEAAAAEARLAE